jgi:RsiW-degrading membrane proteinase PrsW (M82 family)
MKQNMLYLVIGALVVVIIALGVYIYREQTRPKGVELKIDDKGISIQQN